MLRSSTQANHINIPVTQTVNQLWLPIGYLFPYQRRNAALAEFHFSKKNKTKKKKPTIR
jgi:hypothetical protein